MTQPPAQLDEFIGPINSLVNQAMDEGSRMQQPSGALQAEARALVQQIGRSIATGYERGVQEGLRLAKEEGSAATEAT